MLFHRNDEIPMGKLVEKLVALGYDDEPEAVAMGEFSRRGGILDIYSPGMKYPVRLEFFGDQIESMREYSPDSGRSLRELAVRVVLLLLGLCIAHLGVTLFLQTDLGSDPFNVFIQGLYRALPWPAWAAMTHGRTHLLVSLVILLVLLAVDRSYVGIGTVLCMALGGPIIDVYTLWLSPVIHGGLPLPLRLALLVAGCVILAFGMTIVIRSQAGTGPNDLVAVVLSDKLRKPFGPVRIGVDLTFALVGLVLGGVVGLGTVICAFLVGPAAQLFFPISQRLCEAALAQFAGVRSQT